MRLIHSDTKEPVKQGEELVSFRGEKAILKTWQYPHSSASTGRVFVIMNGQESLSYYPSVFNLEWEGR